jgi:hypothetical protein
MGDCWEPAAAAGDTLRARAAAVNRRATTAFTFQTMPVAGAEKVTCRWPALRDPRGDVLRRVRCVASRGDDVAVAHANATRACVQVRDDGRRPECWSCSPPTLTGGAGLLVAELP